MIAKLLAGAALRIFGSLKTELKIILVVIVVLTSMPILATTAMTAAGLAVVSQALAWLNPTTHKVELYDPNGKLLVQLDATTNWPTTGYVSEEFGVPHLPWQQYHTGIDIANPEGKIGDPVTPFMPGKVTKTGSITIGCGLCVYVEHGNNITSHYLHLSKILVEPGQEVKPGDVIGLMGNEGWSTGAHLHFEVRVYDLPVNPRTFVEGEPQLRR